MSHVEVGLDGHVATVSLNRPEALNAISGAVADELAGAVLQAAAQPDVWVMVLAAAGEKAFCVGADLKERNRLDDRGWMRNRVLMRAMFDSLRSVPQPTIASAFGFALGGGFELALSCDLIVAADDAVFGLPEVSVGIVPGEGAGVHRAADWGGRGAGAGPGLAGGPPRRARGRHRGAGRDDLPVLAFERAGGEAGHRSRPRRLA
jgi:enoyl-CoA hydratase/carnithine racemase